MKITYENVCCIRHAVLDLEPGTLIAITGESNQGKSSLLYTLSSGFLNDSSFKRFINNEALKESAKATAKISIVDDKDNFWQVEAGKSHLYYRHNKTKYEKVGRKNLFEVTEAQIPGLLYDPENNSPIMNIVDEDTGMFPIDRSDSQIFKTYERLLSLSCTEDILRTIKIDQEDIDFKISDFTNTIQTSLVKIKDIDKFYEDIENIDLEAKISKLSELINTTNQLTSTYNQINNTARYSEYVLNYPEFEELHFDIEQFEQLVNSFVKASNLQKYINSQCELAKTEDFNTNELLSLCQDLSIAIDLNKDIASLIHQQTVDKNELDDINKILHEIKICPYCGKPMEG